MHVPYNHVRYRRMLKHVWADVNDCTNYLYAHVYLYYAMFSHLNNCYVTPLKLMRAAVLCYALYIHGRTERGIQVECDPSTANRSSNCQRLLKSSMEICVPIIPHIRSA